MKTRVSWFLAMALAAALLASRLAAADALAITLSVSTEDGKKMLVATVTAAGTPVENAKVAFFARRAFGELALGADVTLDDGSAAVSFPSALPGDQNGRLRLSAELANRPKGAARARAEAVFEGGVPFHLAPQATPRALWSSRAPLILLVNIGILVGLVWGAFAYVVFQLGSIRKDAACAEDHTAELGTDRPVIPKPKTPS